MPETKARPRSRTTLPKFVSKAPTAQSKFPWKKYPGMLSAKRGIPVPHPKRGNIGGPHPKSRVTGGQTAKSRVMTGPTARFKLAGPSSKFRTLGGKYAKSRAYKM